MALYSSLASLSQTAASNVADGSVDAPSTIDQQTNLLASFIAKLRDGNGFATGVGNLGQCRLSKSGANLILLPYNGNGLTVNGVACAIPAAGITLAATSLSVGTNYNIYAVATGTAITSLEASTTAHATDSTSGMEIKSGDATRTLVGKARIVTGPAWSDTDAARFVISWFNRRPIRIYTTNASPPTSTTSGIVNVAPIMEFLTWGDAIPASFIAGVSNSTANALSYTALGSDTTSAYSHSVAQYQAYTAAGNGLLSGGSTFAPAEGYHYLSLNHSVGAGTGTWTAGVEASGVIQG